MILLDWQKYKKSCSINWRIKVQHNGIRCTAVLDRIVEEREAITVVLTSNDKISNLQNHEWKTASYAKFLKPFEDLTSMSASRYPTLFMVIPVLNVLKQKMSGTEMDHFGRTNGDLTTKVILI